jgi:hypothetical protein
MTLGKLISVHFRFIVWVLLILWTHVGYSEESNSVVNSPKISGTFIQYQSWMMQMDSKKWNSELDLMRTAGVDTLVIQWLKSGLFRFYPVNIPGNDPTEIILNYADKNQMKVYLGLQADKSWWSNSRDRDYLRKTAENSIALGRSIFKRYGKHSSFQGWYIPYEMSDGDYDEDEVVNYRHFFNEITQGLKKLSSKKYPIGLSVFFNGLIPPKVTQSLYTEILKGSGVSLLMIQDGVGVHDWGAQMNEKVVPYMNAYRAAAQKNKIEVWSVLESFINTKDKSAPSISGSSSERAPTDISRLTEQLKAQASHPYEKILTFDFFHYMSPNRGAGQKALYDSYLSHMNLSR